jgi:GTP cyclohydrolase II
LRQEGRGIGLYNKLDAYLLQQQGLDTYAANRHLGLPDDQRDYECAAHMLKAMGVPQIRLLTNNPEKARQLVAYGVRVDEVIATQTFANPLNQRYLAAKALLTGHSLDVPGLNGAAHLFESHSREALSEVNSVEITSR